MNIEIPSGPGGNKRKLAKQGWKALVFANAKRSSRATAKAIAQNQIAVAAVATSVAAAGVGGIATYKAADAQHSASQAQHAVLDLKTRVDNVQAAQDGAALLIANAQAAVDALDAKSADQLDKLRSSLKKVSAALSNVQGRIDALPPAANLAPLNARLGELAAAAKATAQKAEDASKAAAADRSDPVARNAALDAAKAAAAAKTQADQAADRALYAPQVYRFPDANPASTDSVPVGSVDIDLTGDYLVSIEAQGVGVPWILETPVIYVRGDGSNQSVHKSQVVTLDGPQRIGMTTRTEADGNSYLASISLTLTRVRT